MRQITWPADRGWPANSEPRTDADVYVYRDTGGQPGDAAAGSPGQDAAERDAAYWYDLLAEEPAPKLEEIRGPFEPLVSSAGPPPGAAARPPPGAAARPPAEPDAMGRAGTEPDQAPAGAARDQDLDGTADARARKLERIREFYLTAEAIGEQNVDKHFDQLLAQQRELISDYFRQSAAAQAAAGGPAVTSPGDGLAAEADAGADADADAGADADAEADADADAEAEARDVRGPGAPGAVGGQAGAPEGAGVAAEPPRAW